MPPLAIYSIVALTMLALSIGVWVNRYYATRKCHLCGSQVELGRRKCHSCEYRFIN
jgi:transposase